MVSLSNHGQPLTNQPAASIYDLVSAQRAQNDTQGRRCAPFRANLRHDPAVVKATSFRLKLRQRRGGRGHGMTRDETIALFEACEAKRAEARAAALAEGKDEDEARKIAHEAAKTHWNAWAEERLAERKALEETGAWAAEKTGWGSLEPKNAGTRAWMEQAECSFSRCLFLLLGEMGIQEAPGEDKEQHEAGDSHVKSIAIDSTAIDFSGFVFPGNALFASATFQGDASFASVTFPGAMAGAEAAGHSGAGYRPRVGVPRAGNPVPALCGRLPAASCGLERQGVGGLLPVLVRHSV